MMTVTYWRAPRAGQVALWHASDHHYAKDNLLFYSDSMADGLRYWAHTWRIYSPSFIAGVNCPLHPIPRAAQNFVTHTQLVNNIYRLSFFSSHRQMRSCITASTWILTRSLLRESKKHAKLANSQLGEGRCPVVPLVFKISLGAVRSPEGSTPSLLRQYVSHEDHFVGWSILARTNHLKFGSA